MRRVLAVCVFVFLVIGEVLEEVGFDEEGETAEPEGESAMEDGDDSIFGVVSLWFAEPFEFECVVEELVEEKPDESEETAVNYFMGIFHIEIINNWDIE